MNKEVSQIHFLHGSVASLSHRWLLFLGIGQFLMLVLLRATLEVVNESEDGEEEAQPCRCPGDALSCSEHCALFSADFAEGRVECASADERLKLLARERSASCYR